MPDTPTWAQPGWRSGAYDALSQEIGMLPDGSGYDAKAMVDGLASNSPFARKKLSDLLLATDAVKADKSLGSGWSQDQVAALKPDRPRNDLYGMFYPTQTSSPQPTPRELSPGDRQSHGWNNRKKFLESLTKDPVSEVSAWTGTSRPDADREGAYLDYMQELGRTHGTSGWAGSMENPEYTFGNVMTKFLDPMSNAGKYYGRGDAKSVSDALNMASDYSGLQEAGNAISPVLPGNIHEYPEEIRPVLRDAATARLKQATFDAAPKPYRDYHRETSGEWPSYAKETGVEFLANLADPTSLIAYPLAAARGITAAAKTAKGATLIPRLMALGGAAATAMGQEGLEEVPLYAAATAALNPPESDVFSSERPELDEHRYNIDQRNKARQEALDYYQKNIAPRLDQSNAYQNAGYGAM